MESRRAGWLLTRDSTQTQHQTDDADYAHDFHGVFLTVAAETPMEVMREIAAGVREDALSGLSTADRDRFVDALLTIKSNLMAQTNGAWKAVEQDGC